MTTSQAGPGPVIVIGGHEDKQGPREILREVARRLDGGRLVIATIASRAPEGYFDAYRQAFAGLGAGALDELYVEDRAEASDPARLALLESAAGVFFSGGDQLRIISQIGETPLERRLRDLYVRGGLIAGTSAGASAMGEVMVVRGPGDESFRIGDLDAAPGLGLVAGLIIDQHFAERGRIGRLLGAVAQNPRMLGVGIDENTAAVIEGRRFRVVGSGAVYVVDGAEASAPNLTEAKRDTAVSILDVRLQVLARGQGFDLDRRRPTGEAACRPAAPNRP